MKNALFSGISTKKDDSSDDDDNKKTAEAQPVNEMNLLDFDSG